MFNAGEFFFVIDLINLQDSREMFKKVRYGVKWILLLFVALGRIRIY
jgi:hypothetical protein